MGSDRAAREAAEQAELDRAMNLGHEPGGVLDKSKPVQRAKPQGQRKYKDTVRSRVKRIDEAGGF